MLTIISPSPILRKAYFYAPPGPVIDEPDSPAMTVLLNFVKAEARRRRAFMLKIEPGVEDGDTRWLTALHKRGFRATPYSSLFRHEWVLDLRPDEKTLLAGMKEKWRYNIRLAGRKGVIVRRGEGEVEIETSYLIYETTSTRDGSVSHNITHA